jgi:hypothetical protein
VSTLTLAPPATETPAILHVPTVLPENHRGEPLRQLSYSAVNRFQRCPEDFRRSYIRGEWGPKSGAMFLGSRVDETLTGFYRRRLDGELLDLDALKDLYNDLWRGELAKEAARNGPVRWGDGLDADSAHALGIKALALTMTELVPRLGRPITVQRRFELKIDQRLQWSIVGIVDLDTVREQTVYVTDDGSAHSAIRDEGCEEPMIALPYAEAPADLRGPVKLGRGLALEPRDAIAAFERKTAEFEERVILWRAGGEESPAPKAPKALPEIEVPVSRLSVASEQREVVGITDYKVTTSPRSEYAAGGDLQASIYLGERWLAGEPVFDFRFAQVAKPKEGRRVNMSTSLVSTRRAPLDLQTVFMRVAQTANQIWALYSQLGPDRHWGWAPEEWRCRYCTYGPQGTADCPLALAGRLPAADPPLTPVALPLAA